MESNTTRNEIVERYAHLVRPVAISLKSRLGSAGFDLDDLIGWGNIGLIAAAERFDQGREETFAAYARHKIRGAILDACGREFRDAVAERVDDHVYQLRAPEPLPDEQLLEQEQTEQVTEAIGSLTSRQKKVIEFRYFGGLTQAATGKRLGGISQPGVRDLESRAVGALRRRMA